MTPARSRARRPSRIAAACALAAAVASALPARAGDAGVLRVGTSGDYAPFSIADPEAEGGHRGFDVDLARRYAQDRGLELRFVRFRWPELLRALERDRFDVAFSGVTVRPERSAAGSFSVPVLETGAVVLLPEASWRDLDVLDQPEIRIGVNAGGHLERVAARRFPRATRVAIPDNASVLEALRAESVSAVVTDSAEAPHWLAQMEGLMALGPFTRDLKAPLVAPGRSRLAADLDAWLLARERDGTLAALRREHLGDADWRRTAEPLAALLSAVDERLSLMPTVAVVKREQGVPLEVPEREAHVLDAAAAAVLEAASAADRVPPSILVIRAFFRAQMEAAKQIQRDTVAEPASAPEPPLPDLEADLRPALLRIGARIARLVVALPPELDVGRVHALARELLREPRLTDASRHSLAEAIAALSPVTGRPRPDAGAPGGQARTNARASRPAITGSTMQTP